MNSLIHWALRPGRFAFRRNARAQLKRLSPGCIALLLLLVFAGGRAAEWEMHPGYRMRSLPVAPGGHTGFSVIAPEKSGVWFTNYLAAEVLATNSSLIAGAGVALGELARWLMRNGPSLHNRTTRAQLFVIRSRFTTGARSTDIWSASLRRQFDRTYVLKKVGSR